MRKCITVTYVKACLTEYPYFSIEDIAKSKKFTLDLFYRKQFEFMKCEKFGIYPQSHHEPNGSHKLDTTFLIITIFCFVLYFIEF